MPRPLSVCLAALLTIPPIVRAAVLAPAAAQAPAAQAPTTQPPAARTAQDEAVLGALSRQGKEAMDAGQYDKAAGIYRKVLRAMPNEPGILMNLGMALYMAGRPMDAIDPLTRSLKLKPDVPTTALFLGNSLLDVGRAAEAIPQLERFVKGEPGDAHGRYLLASARLMAGDLPAAATDLRDLAGRTPKDPKVWSALVQCYDALAQDAIDALQQMPDGARYLPLLAADALESAGKPEQAFVLYKQSLGALPDFRSTHTAIARIYEKTGHPDWARQQEGLARRIPIDCTTTQKAECELAAGRHLAALTALGTRTDAESQYWRARANAELMTTALDSLAALPPSVELHELRAEMYRKQRQHQQAIKEMKAAIALAPDQPHLQYGLARSLYYARDWDAARALYEKLLKAAPGDPELQFYYGQILLQAQQGEAALPYLEAAVKTDPSMPAGRAALGRAYVQTGRFAQAIPHLEAVLQDDEDGSVHYQLARAYQSTGQADRAKPLLARYQELQRAAQTHDAPEGPAVITAPPPR